MRNSLFTIYKLCKDNITEIEGFYEAVSDRSESYDCHHRLETHDEFGNLRNTLISSVELIEQDLYYNRPASELIFLRKSEHSALHRQFSNIDGHRYLNCESRRTEHSRINSRKYRLDKDKYSKQLESNKKYQDKHREEIREYARKYHSKLCLYEGKTVTLGSLGNKFRTLGIAHPYIEAKKYLLKE